MLNWVSSLNSIVFTQQILPFTGQDFFILKKNIRR